MNSDSIKATHWFALQLDRIILLKDFITAIDIFSSSYTNFGYSFYSFNIAITYHKKKHTAYIEEYKKISVSLPKVPPEDGIEHLHFYFPIQSKQSSQVKYSQEMRPRYIMEFANCYTTLSMFCVNFLDQHAPQIKLNVRNLTEHPEINFVQDLYNKLPVKDALYTNHYASETSRGDHKFYSLYHAAATFKNTGDCTNRLLIKETAISKDRLAIAGLRTLLLQWEIPFITSSNSKVIEEILIDVYALQEALEKRKDQRTHGMAPTVLLVPLRKIIEKYIQLHGANFKKKAAYLKKTEIGINAVIYLYKEEKGKAGGKTNKKLVIGKVTKIEHTVNGLYLHYSVLNANLELSQYKGECSLNEIAKLLKAGDYSNLASQYAWTHRDQLKRHFEKKVRAFKVPDPA
jgi:hypothetical protein